MLQLGLYPFSFALKSAVPSVFSNISTLYPDHLYNQSDFSDFSVEIDYRRFWGWPFKSRINFYLDGFSPFAFNPIEHAAAVFEWGMNWCVANHIMTYHVVHAATVAKDDFGVMLCGQSGSGKSTLSCAMMAEGWRLLTDELTLLSLESPNIVTPFVRPVSIKETAINVLKRNYSSLVFGEVAHNTDKGTVTHVRPTEYSWHNNQNVCAIKLIVFPVFTPNLDEVTVEEIEPVEAFNVISEQSFNLNALGGKALKPLAALIESTTIVRLRYSNLKDAIAFIATWLPQ